MQTEVTASSDRHGLSLSLVSRILPVGASSLHIRLLAKILQILEQQLLKTTLLPSLDGGPIRALPGVSCLPKSTCVWSMNVLIAGSCIASPSYPCQHPWVPALWKQGHRLSQFTQRACESTEEIILAWIHRGNYSSVIIRNKPTSTHPNQTTTVYVR